MLKGKNAIITGSNRGIGFAVLQKFAENGCNIWACARKKNDEFEENIAKIAKDNNVWIKPVYFDLTSQDEIKNGFKEIYSEKKVIDILVNNAGIGHSALFQMTSLNDFDNIININFKSQMYLMQLTLKVMQKQKSGSVVNVSSMGAVVCAKGQAAYVASKSALLSVSKVAAKEVGESNIRINVVAPGLTNTDMMQQNIPKEIYEKTLSDNTCLKRLGQPSEVANVIMFLASDLASYMTGQVVSIDGGMY